MPPKYTAMKTIPVRMKNALSFSISTMRKIITGEFVLGVEVRGFGRIQDSPQEGCHHGQRTSRSSWFKWYSATEHGVHDDDARHRYGK